MLCNLAACPDDYEGPPKGVEDFFQARLDCELTDAEASDLRQQSQAFKKDSNSDYKVEWFGRENDGNHKDLRQF